MTEPTPDQAALATAQALTAALDGVQGELRAVNDRQDDAELRQAEADRRQRRDRILILLTILSLVIDLTVTGLFINNNVRLDHATSELQHTRATVAQVHQTLVAGCQAGNANKAGQVKIWDKLASLSPPAATTPPSVAARQEAKVQQFLAFIGRVDAPRNCAAAYKLPGGKP